jgi:hypothetical protein
VEGVGTGVESTNDMLQWRAAARLATVIYSYTNV